MIYLEIRRANHRIYLATTELHVKADKITIFNPSNVLLLNRAHKLTTVKGSEIKALHSDATILEIVKSSITAYKEISKEVFNALFDIADKENSMEYDVTASGYSWKRR